MNKFLLLLPTGIYLCMYISFIWRFPISRAFVKEADGDDVSEDLPERIHSDEPNYITPAGEKHLREKLRLLGEKHKVLSKENEHLGKKGDLQRLDNDIKYFRERLHRAIICSSSDPFLLLPRSA